MSTRTRLFFSMALLFLCFLVDMKLAGAAPVLIESLAQSSTVQSTGRAEIQKKKEILLNSVVKLRQDYDLKADYLRWVTANGNVKQWKVPTLQEELYRRWQQSRIDHYLPKENALHLAEPGSEERNSQLQLVADTIFNDVLWTNVGPALVALGGLVSIVPEAGDPVGLGIELVKQIGHAIGETDTVTKDNAKRLLEKYQPEVGKLSPTKLRELLSDLYWKQAQEIVAELLQLKATNQSSIGASTSAPLGLASFDVSSGELSFSHDLISSVDNSLGDSIVGANVQLPTFKYMGATTWGDHFTAFAALDYWSEIVKSGDPQVQVLTDLPTLLFLPEQNVFAGIMPYFINVFDTPGISAQLAEGLESSDPLFPFIRITPTVDFWTATNGFTKSGSSEYQNQLFQIGYPIAEPPVVLLLGSALGALWLMRRRRRIR